MATTAKMAEQFAAGQFACLIEKSSLTADQPLRVFARYRKANGMQWLITPFGGSPRTALIG
jgi:hypothetical protein